MTTRILVDRQADAALWAFERLRGEETVKLQELYAAVQTLRFVAKHATGLRVLIHHIMSRDGGSVEPTPEEREALLNHPAARAVIEQFPEAVIGIRPIGRANWDGDAGNSDPDSGNDA